MPYTNAEKQKRARDRAKAKLERYEAALREISESNPARPLPGSHARDIANRALHIEVL